ncbi:transglycosylase family protein [Kitasatospora sp. NPDC090308]|uniref:transglycosylase family protein n=1 Tax=Kitasatospora sp. NPDC090308 TaxID=3364082 RepID=UPI0037F6267F
MRIPLRIPLSSGRALIALGLLLPAAAVTTAGTPAAARQAVSDAVWDRLADCESDGDWQADTGNGYYGGLQIWPPTWRETGGLRYADRPDRASRRQQITVGEEILRRQGWNAWGWCARKIGVLE